MEQWGKSNNMAVNQIADINNFVQHSCRIRTGKRLHRVVFDTGAGKGVMSYSFYLLITGYLKAPLQSNYIRLTTENNTELINKVSTIFKLGKRKLP